MFNNNNIRLEIEFKLHIFVMQNLINSCNSLHDLSINQIGPYPWRWSSLPLSVLFGLYSVRSTLSECCMWNEDLLVVYIHRFFNDIGFGNNNNWKCILFIITMSTFLTLKVLNCFLTCILLSSLSVSTYFEPIWKKLLQSSIWKK